MLKPLLLIIMCLSYSLIAYDWEHVYTVTGQYENFNKLYFFSPDTGFATGYGITGTTDGGRTWKRVSEDLTYTNAITFTDRMHGFASGGQFAAPFIRRTVDGGKTWQTITLPDSLDFFAYKNILFLDSLTGFLPGGYGNIYPYPNSRGQILKTVDGGNTWRKVYHSGYDKINDIVVDPKSGHLYAGGGPNPGNRAIVAKSYDNGENWKVKVLDSIKFELRDIQFVNNENIMVTSTRYFCKLDSALTIKHFYFEQNYDTIAYSNINFFNKDTGFAIGGNIGYPVPLYLTKNGGLTWEIEIECENTAVKFYDVCLIDSVIYVATFEKLYKASTTTSISNDLKQNSNLLSVYPNPFNNSAVINYSLAVPGYINLAVYNVKGQLVGKIIGGHQNAGKHNATFNAIGLNSGVYFVRLSGENINVIKKIMLIK